MKDCLIELEGEMVTYDGVDSFVNKAHNFSIQDKSIIKVGDSDALFIVTKVEWNGITIAPYYDSNHYGSGE